MGTALRAYAHPTLLNVGYLALGVVPTIAQLVGLGIVLVGFRLTMR